MSKLSNRDIFIKLNDSYRTIYEYELFTGDPFRCWYLNDILSTIDNVNNDTYKNSYTLERVFRESIPIRMRAKNPDKINALFTENVHIIDQYKYFNAEMSPYACWALVRQIGDSAIFHQEYFLRPGANFKTIQDNTDQTLRISLRAFVTKYEKQLNGILWHLNQGKSFTTTNYSGLRREITSKLFDGVSTYDIRMSYHMGETKPLTDYMNCHLLSAYGEMLQKIVNTWDGLIGMRTYNNLRDIANMTAAKTRAQFSHGAPIQNFDQSSVDTVIKQRGQREAEFTKQFLVQAH